MAPAIAAANLLERKLNNNLHYDPELYELEEEEVCLVRYKWKMRYLELCARGCADHEVPLVPHTREDFRATPSNSQPCACGGGRAPLHPWQVQPETLGFCHSEVCMERRFETQRWWIDQSGVGRRFGWI